MRPPRIVRSIAFALSLVATAILALASGFSIVLCVEPDGCVELELIGPGESSRAGCVDHEHEVGSPASSPESLADECPCEDTVLALLAAAASAKPAKSKQDIAPGSGSKSPPIVAAALPFVAPRDRALGSKIAAPRMPSSVPSYSSYSRGSVVLRS